jgi:hypothetical protein
MTDKEVNYLLKSTLGEKVTKMFYKWRGKPQGDLGIAIALIRDRLLELESENDMLKQTLVLKGIPFSTKIK